METRLSTPDQYMHLEKLAGGTISLSELHSRRQNYASLKRACDLLFVFAVSPIILPMLLVVTALVRLDSPGPIFFAQRRLRLGGHSFDVFKFRTMSIDANDLLEKHLDDNDHARAEWELSHKLKNDPRITRVGKFLRSSSLDELPQFFNVLKGDMSIVGPRPIVRAEVERYGPAFAVYCTVRPGLTGLWQISGRSRLTFEERVSLDQEYAHGCSLPLDLKILAKTIRVVFRQDGAY